MQYPESGTKKIPENKFQDFNCYVLKVYFLVKALNLK